MAEVLMEITKDQLETGLRGVPVGYCTTSSVDPKTGLFYVGKSVSELSSWEPERAIYLLYYGKEGTVEDIKSFTKELAKRASCKPETLQRIRSLPRSGHPMKLFCAALLIAGMLEGKNNYREDCLNLIAKIPEIAATVINYHAGWPVVSNSKPELGYMGNFVHLLNPPLDNREQLTRIFKLFNVLHYDHGGGNLSTFVAKAVASGLEDMYGSICAGMCALAGPRHGKANQDCLEFVEQILSELGGKPTENQVEDLIRKRLANNELVYGFGHAVLRVEDPRATVLYKVADELFPNHPLCIIAHQLRHVGPKVLGENPKITNPFPNVDAISGVLLTAAGFPYPEYFTVLFGLSRTVGIAMQIVYERCEARGGKGTPIVRPKYLYKNREELSDMKPEEPAKS
ncbi:MAG: citrate (Si)-synthase [Parachlamydiaceae bacterium]|nr:citrate (Si)-synthase [Parachlamydiaceae bacterium]